MSRTSHMVVINSRLPWQPKTTVLWQRKTTAVSVAARGTEGAAGTRTRLPGQPAARLADTLRAAATHVPTPG